MASVFVFGLLVLFHEFGHFIMAKCTGMRVDEFAIGFGPRLISHKYGETVYSIRAVPLGGFNDIAGMTPDENDAGERGYCEKPILKRMIVILSGPLMNFILPIFIFFLLFIFIGVSSPSNRPELGDIIPNKPAAMAGLKTGDIILKMNDNEISSWNDIVNVIHSGGMTPIKIKYLRDGNEMETTLIPVYDNVNNKPVVGIISSVDISKPGFLEAIWLAIYKTGYIIYRMLEGLVMIFSGEAIDEIAGPIGVAQMAGEVAKSGFAALLNFAALLSLNLGIINLLPVPALDGGHFATLILEGLRGKPLSVKVMQYTQIAGITLLVILMLFATKNDITRIFIGN